MGVHCWSLRRAQAGNTHIDRGTLNFSCVRVLTEFARIFDRDTHKMSTIRGQRADHFDFFCTKAPHITPIFGKLRRGELNLPTETAHRNRSHRRFAITANKAYYVASKGVWPRNSCGHIMYTTTEVREGQDRDRERDQFEGTADR